jgi:hypothetical protein
MKDEGSAAAKLAAALERATTASRELEAALVRSDFAAVEAATRALDEAAATLRALLQDGAMLQLRKGAADTQSMDGSLRRIERLAGELRERQERNAFLVLAALRLREQWRRLLAGMTAPTYGPSGAPELRPGRRVISRKA